MYPSPQVIWVAGLVRQSAPALAILEPGRACGIPYAPLDLFSAVAFHLLSFIQSRSRHANWSSPQPRWAARDLAIALDDPGSTLMVDGSSEPTTTTSVRGSRVTVRSTTVRETSVPPTVWMA
ncbi:hypothetical protein D3C74_421760 [compost metagenome]